MKKSEVRKLADGRIYTALQAKKLGLVDEIGTFEDAVEDMKKEYNLGSCEVEDFICTSSNDFFPLLGEGAAGKIPSGLLSADMVEELTSLNGKFELSYMSQVRK